MPDKPLVGSFWSKPDNTPRKEAAPEPKASAGEPIKEPANSEGPPVEETPAERYRKRLADAKIPANEAHAIYDAVLDKGFYEEYVRIGKKRVTFRTRSYEEQLRIQTALEQLQPRSALAHDEIISRYNLAGSLYEWDNKPVGHETDADYDAILRLIRQQPQPVISMLYDKLARFDQKIMFIFSEGATDSF